MRFHFSEVDLAGPDQVRIADTHALAGRENTTTATIPMSRWSHQRLSRIVWTWRTNDSTGIGRPHRVAADDAFDAGSLCGDRRGHHDRRSGVITDDAIDALTQAEQRRDRGRSRPQKDDHFLAVGELRRTDHHTTIPANLPVRDTKRDRRAGGGRTFQTTRSPARLRDSRSMRCGPVRPELTPMTRPCTIDA